MTHSDLLLQEIERFGGKQHNISGISDVTVEAVVLSFYLNSLLFTILLVFFEVLRRWLPTIYNGALYHKDPGTQEPKLDTRLVAFAHCWNDVCIAA